MAEPVDPLLLGQRVVAILETGRRTAVLDISYPPWWIRVSLPDH
nr:hypothetical protein [Mycobacterium lepraemurium]